MGIKVNKTDNSTKTKIVAVKGKGVAVQRSGKGCTKVTHKNGAEDAQDYEAVSVITGPHHATVSVSASRTINMGDYNSVKVEVFLSLPADPVEKHINGAYEYVRNWVDAKMEELTEQINAG